MNGCKTAGRCHNDGPSDACIATPIIGSEKAVIVSNGINPKYSDVDPYISAASAIDEALRNIIAVGGTMEKLHYLTISVGQS